MTDFVQWEGFQGKNWVNSVDVRDFIQCNYTPYGINTLPAPMDPSNISTSPF